MSKGLEDFKELKKTTCFYCQYHINEECANGECIWNNVEKSLKAIDVIKDICKLKVYKNKLGQCFLEGTNILFPISQETYDLLKEVLL